MRSPMFLLAQLLLRPIDAIAQMHEAELRSWLAFIEATR